MPDLPLISVLMPAHNAERYLAEAVDSVLAQTLGDFEFIIVDDGSVDGTPKILQHYARKDQRIRIRTGANEGVSPALNHGLAMVRGEFVARMDSDDICLPDRFAKQAEFLRLHPDHVLVGARCMLIDPAGFPICEKHDIVLEHDEIEAALLRVGWPLVHPAVMGRADALRKVGGYDARLRANEDHDLFLRLAEVGKLANLPEVLLKYRQHLQSAAATKPAAWQREIYEIVKAAHQRRGRQFEIPPIENAKLLTASDRLANWYWWSLQAGNIATARRHARAMVRAAPWSAASWRALYCSVRGR